MPIPGETNLRGVHPDLARVVRRAHTMAPGTFRVGEGVRTLARQKQLKAAGASKTLRSRHIPSTSKRNPQWGHAVDLICTIDGKVRWDWPLYNKLAKIMKAAAKAEGVTVTWGGSWASFPDGPHYQLDWTVYP